MIIRENNVDSDRFNVGKDHGNDNNVIVASISLTQWKQSLKRSIEGRPSSAGYFIKEIQAHNLSRQREKTTCGYIVT